jgi:hypothetical protein
MNTGGKRLERGVDDLIFAPVIYKKGLGIEAL